MALFLRITLTLFLICCNASANILIFQSSDNHSEYGHIPNYIRATANLAQAFRQKFPGHPIIHMFNGDLAGPSDFTAIHGVDRGDLNYEVLARLGTQYRILLNQGNHEGFDYLEEAGNRLFVTQNRKLMRKLQRTELNKNFRLTTANLQLAERGRSLYQNYQDLISPSGQRIRFVGLVLDALLGYSTYDTSVPTQVFSKTLSMLEVAKQQLLEAAATQVDAVVFFCHEQYTLTKPFLEALLKWKHEQEIDNPKLAHLQIPAVFASHDHEVHYEHIESTDLIDSGTGYAFTHVVLDDDGHVIYRKHWPITEQVAEFQNSQDMRPVEQGLIRQVETMVDEIEHKANAILKDHKGHDIVIPRYAETRLDLRKARYPLGTKLATTLQRWALAETMHDSSPLAGVLGFMNSGSYRSGLPIDGGSLKYRTVVKVYPNPGKAKLLSLTGEQVQRLYTALRTFGISRSEYTPQIDENLREGENFQLLHHRNGSWMPLDPQGIYILGLDKWLGMNGFRIPEWDEVFKNVTWLQPQLEEARDIFIQYLPELLQVDHCKAALEALPDHLPPTPNAELTHK